MGKLIAGAALLVLVAWVFLALSTRRSEKATAGPSLPEARGRQTWSSPLQHVHVPEPSASVESQAPSAVDFDWRQTLTNDRAPPKLTREKVEQYLEQHKRNAASLLASYRALEDTNYLREAITNFPNDPRVQLSVLARDVFPEERRKWLDLFKASSPDNSLANYLSARDYFKDGQSESAIRELLDGTAKPLFENYAMESKLDEEELNMTAGRSSLQARLSSSGWVGDLLPQLATFKGLAQDIAGLEKRYSDAGDPGSAQHLAEMGLMLANRLDSGDSARFAINQLVGFSIESIALSQLDPNASYEFLGGKTPIDTLAGIKLQRASLRTLTQNLQATLPRMSEAELLNYSERQRLYGEAEAMRWLQQNGNAGTRPDGSP